MDLEIKKDLTSNWFKLLQESICIDINGTEVFKVLPQNTYPDKAIEELFSLNNLNITRIVEGNGFRSFFYSTIVAFSGALKVVLGAASLVNLTSINSVVPIGSVGKLFLYL